MESPVIARPQLSSIWLEITGRCQLACHHCYADSSPAGNHGTMTLPDWQRIIDEADELGCELVQIIGGEPLLHPDFGEILSYATSLGMDVEVATNLVHVTDDTWALFLASGNVSLAVSYYGADAATHAAVTGTKGSHARTRANLVKAVELGITTRGNVIRVNDDQNVEAAVADLKTIGIVSVGVDDVRGIGRGGTVTDDNGMGSLCGNCGIGRAAVLPNGDVTPCVIGRRHVTGNVLANPLAQVINGTIMKKNVRDIKAATAWECACGPDNECDPYFDQGHPCTPFGGGAAHEHHAACGPEDSCSPDLCRPASGVCGPTQGGSEALVTAGVGRHAPTACKPKKPCGPDGICQPSSGDCRPTRRCKPSKG